MSQNLKILKPVKTYMQDHCVTNPEYDLHDQ
jgi:hypothetical protein